MQKVCGLYMFILMGAIPLIGNDILNKKTSFVIVTASYNNKDFYEGNLSSVFSQNYDNWHLIYINDCSTDGTGQLVQDFIDQHKMNDKVTLINNSQRHRHLYNQYHAIHHCHDNCVVVILDGDDKLAHPEVLTYLNKVYQDPNIWMTYGQFRFESSGRLGRCVPLPADVVEQNNIRKFKWVTDHLRTFYAGLFKRIKKEDLMFNGSFFPRCADVAIMFPMAEMAGEHIKFIPDVLYLYNDKNPIQRRPQERAFSFMSIKEIRKRQRYDRIKKAPYLSI